MRLKPLSGKLGIFALAAILLTTGFFAGDPGRHLESGVGFISGARAAGGAVKGTPDPVSDFIKAGLWDVSDAQGEMVKEFKKEHELK